MDLEQNESHSQFDQRKLSNYSDSTWDQICKHVDIRKPNFRGESWIAYIVMAVIFIVFMVPLVVVIRRRNYPEVKARSPILTAICIFLLMCDSITNTWLFSLDPSDRQNEFLICMMGVWSTMCFDVPVLMTMYLRVYRLKRVFQLYENYLKTMRVTLGS